jgi:hypothetical protein
MPTSSGLIAAAAAIASRSRRGLMNIAIAHGTKKAPAVVWTPAEPEPLLS